MELRLVAFCAGMVVLGTLLLSGFRSSDPLQALPDDARVPQAAETEVRTSGVQEDGRLCLNTADAAALETLPGIGVARATAIMDLRERLGGFRDTRDLLQLQGLGEKSLLKLLPHITLTSIPAVAVAGPTPLPVASESGTPKLPAQSISPAVVASPTVVGIAATGPVNINTAVQSELETLNGIGPALAQRIIYYRSSYGPFRSPADLDAVKGIGPSILQKNQGRIVTR